MMLEKQKWIQPSRLYPFNIAAKKVNYASFQAANTSSV